MLDDLAAAGGERLDGRRGDVGDVCDAVVDRAPGDAEATGELPAQLSLVEEPDRTRPPVQRAGVKSRPPAVGGRVDEIGDDDVGVELRLGGPGGPVAGMPSLPPESAGEDVDAYAEVASSHGHDATDVAVR